MRDKHDIVTSESGRQQVDVADLCVSVRELARLLSRSRSTIEFWWREKGLPRTAGGLYSVKAVLLWLESHYRQTRTRTVGGTGLTEQDLARLFSVTRQTVFAWRKKGLPRTENGTYSLGQVCKWLRRFYTASAEKKYQKRLSAMRHKVTRNCRQLERFLAGGKVE